MSDVTTSRIRTFGGVTALVLSVIVIGLAALAGWLRVQLLDTDVWTETSRATLAEPAVQDALSTWAVDTLYERVEPDQLLEQALPPRFDVLAAPASAALRQAAVDAADRAVASQPVEAAWVQANRRAHERFVRIVHGDDPIVVETAGGLRLDLRPLLERIAQRVGLDQALVERIPERLAVVTPKRSAQAERVLDSARVLERISLWLPPLGVGLFALGLWLVRGRRRSAIAWWGFGLVVVGFVVAGARMEIGPFVADAMTDVTTWNAAILATWERVSWELVLAARTVSIVGALAMLGAWLGGEGAVARRVREHAGGWIDEHFVATWVGVVVAAALLLRVSEALSALHVRTQLLLLVLAAVGGWALLRELSREPRVRSRSSATP